MFYCIYGIFELWIIGINVLFGCICMINQDVIDFYNYMLMGMKVVVLNWLLG